uniref:Platelet endothelial cell adhesion molecule n=1 Tax=Cynoglossus semilaevis TaxID=244447 RepID=A0A3P8WAJ5_CYNSE
MVLLPLLTSMLLSSYFHPGSVVDAQRSFTIRNITLSVEPSAEVPRGTNVTIRCTAVVSSSGQEPLNRKYSIYQGSNNIYTKNTITSEDLLYLLPDARVSNTGKYKCAINIEGKNMQSDATKLTVTGLSKPTLHLNKGVVSEDSKIIEEKLVNSTEVEFKLRFSSVGYHKVHCTYSVLMMPDSFKSEESNTITVSVKEMSITPVLEIYPQSRIYEGDVLSITCTIRNMAFNPSTAPIYLYLSQGTRLLSSGDTKVNYSTVALAEDPMDFECRLEIGTVAKVTTKMVPVTELFSTPTITMSPTVVFQREDMSLTCNSEKVASERINRENVTYSLEPPNFLLTSTKPGVFSGKTMMYEFNYTCVAQAKGITKYSATLSVKPKVLVSIPKISVVQGRAVLGEPFEILCHSDIGSYPINYTLLWDYEPLNTTTVWLPKEQARFKVTIRRPEEINKFMCEAKNNLKITQDPLSKRLNATVIVPLTEPTLTILPELAEVSEGDQLYLICGTKGSPPVTFKFYRVGDEQPKFTTTSNINHTHYRVNELTKGHGGTYYCEAINQANNVFSERVTVEVQMALWKKALIGGICLVVLSLLVLGCVLYFKSKRARVVRTAVSVWSERPPDAGNDEVSSVVSNEPDVEYTEVVHPQPLDTVRAPLRKGTDTVYSELKNPPHGAADLNDYQGSVEYVERPEAFPPYPEVNNYQDLPVPVE